MRGVDHDGVHACAHQRLDALLGALAHTYGCAHAQFAECIACGVGKAGLLCNVFDGDQALELKGFVHHQ